MAKVQILLPFKGQNLPYFINENDIFHIEDELFVLTKAATLDQFGQLIQCKSKIYQIIHIKTGLSIFDMNNGISRMDKKDLFNNPFEYMSFYCPNRDELFYKDLSNRFNIVNDIASIESSYFSKLEKKKPILQKLGKYKITDNSLLSYNAELVKKSDSKYIISEFKKWVKFVNEVALFSGYKAELTNNAVNEYTCTIIHDKGQYKFDLYLSDTMLFDFKQCLGISEIKHEINQNNTDTVECINNNIEPDNEPKNSIIIVSDSIYNSMLSKLLVNVSILNPIRLVKSDINIEVPDINAPTIDKDYITIEYPKGYTPPPPKKITKLDNKDIIYYEPIKESSTKLIVTAAGILVEFPKNFKIDSMDSKMNKNNKDNLLQKLIYAIKHNNNVRTDIGAMKINSKGVSYSYDYYYIDNPNNKIISLFERLQILTHGALRHGGSTLNYDYRRIKIGNIEFHCEYPKYINQNIRQISYRVLNIHNTVTV